MFLNSFCRIRLKTPDLANLPSALKAPLTAMPIMLMVGGPPTNTVVGMARLKTVGSTITRGPPFLRSRKGAAMPTAWQDSTGWAMCDIGSPSATTVALPMKTSSSLSGSLGANGKPGGMCTTMPAVPAVARFMPDTVMVAPMMGM